METDGSVWCVALIVERYLNLFVLLLFVAVPAWAYFNDQPFTITLMTRAAIFALAATGLNIALGPIRCLPSGHYKSQALSLCL